jgi:rubrerythrin
MSDDVTKPGEQVDDGKARVFPCEGCGSDLEFHIGQQDLKCPFCGFEKQLDFAEDATVAEQDFHAMLAKMSEHHDKDRRDEEGQSEISCDSCGGTVVFQGALTSTECPFCASPIQLEDVHDAEHSVPVDGVLPFLVEKNVVKTNLATWVKSRWFTPNEFKQRGRMKSSTASTHRSGRSIP